MRGRDSAAILSAEMTFAALILKNLFRQKVRTLLTVLGIAVGITTVVALGVVTEGMKQTSGELIRTGDADFMVAQDGAADFSFSTVQEEEWARIARRPDVAVAVGVLYNFAAVGSNAFFPEMGVRPDQLRGIIGRPRAGRLLSGAPDEVVLGAGAASALRASVGSHVRLGGGKRLVVGIFRSHSTYENSGGYLPLRTVQRFAGKPGTVTAVYVKVTPGEDPERVASSIERTEPTLATIADVGEYGKVDQGMTVIDAVQLAITLLAVGLGAIGVTNTMVMSVFERTREIGILRAVGWSRRRILGSVFGESIALCAVATVLGLVLGVAASQAIMLVPSISSFLTPVYAPTVFIRAVAIALLVGLVGAAYPAIRATRLTPMEALRHE
jgi:putative ABC transport system permease protein